MFALALLVGEQIGKITEFAEFPGGSDTRIKQADEASLCAAWLRKSAVDASTTRLRFSRTYHCGPNQYSSPERK